MKRKLALLVSSSLLLIGTAHSQTQPAPQTRPDARYPSPSGQDSNPGTTTVKPTKPAPKSAHPEDPHADTNGAAAKQTYQAGKKPDDAAGCSTPAAASDARVKPDPKTLPKQKGKDTVCTTSGEDRTHVATKPKAAPKRQPSDR